MRPQIAGFVVARGGSKSIPRKNMQLVAGKPLIAWTFISALESGMLDRVILDTDSVEIAECARTYGIEVPFMRPAELGRDDVHVMKVTLHALQWLEAHEGYCPDYYLLLQPTTPLRSARDIRSAIGLALSHDADAVVSVMPVDHHPFWMRTIDQQGRMNAWMPTEKANSRRQDLPPMVCLNGVIYLVKRTVLLDKQTWCPPNAYAYVMPPERSLDVDTYWDLHLVRLVMNDRLRSGTVSETADEPEPITETVTMEPAL